MNDYYHKALSFYNLIRDEIKNSTQLYGKEDAETLRDYYQNIVTNEIRYNYICRHYASRIIPLIKNIKSYSEILDVGCGTGSESILCGILGGTVLGIDISKERIGIAKKRIKYFENKLNKEINAKFCLKNIFKHFGKYDVIWANEAIQHIAPLNEFLKISYENLKMGGKLIIADQNRLNPYAYLLSKKAQKKKNGLYITRKELNTGEVIYYAIERIYTILEIKKIMLKFFKKVEILPFTYFPFFIFRNFSNFCMKIENKFLRKIPIIKLFSLGYVIISTKI